MKSIPDNICIEAMPLALKLAVEAAALDEVPVACVIVCGGQIILSAHNSVVRDCDPTAHAEIVAIRKAALLLKTDKLFACDLYSTLEPCVMCAGAIIEAGISRMFYAAEDYSSGAVNSGINIFDLDLNHHTEVFKLSQYTDESSSLLKNFFRKKRAGTNNKGQTRRVKNNVRKTREAEVFESARLAAEKFKK